MMSRTLLASASAIVLAMAATPVMSATQTQSDWSGGDGQPGPVLSFGNRFDDGNLAWLTSPGQVSLSSVSRISFPSEVITPDSDRPARLAVYDIDGDGYDDILIPDPLISPFDPDDQRGAIYLWRQLDGEWTRTSVTEDFLGSWYVDAVDMDFDGDLDIIASAYYGMIDPPPPPPEQRNGRFAWFENLDGEGGAWEQREIGELFWGARWVSAADIDGDGDLDLAGCSELVGGPYEADAFVVWFENVDGQGETWNQHDVSDDFDNAFVIHTVDMDGDLDVDLLVAGYGRFEWFENLNGTGENWTQHIISPVFQGAGYMDVGDLDDDGDIDIFGGGLNTGVMAAWLNDGTGLNWSASIVGSFTRGYNTALADVDGDGDLDGVASGANGTTFSKLGWAENLGNGTSWELRYPDISAPSHPWAAVGDIDRDGKPELVASFEDSYGQGIQIAAYTLTDFLPLGELESSVLDGGTPSWGTLIWDADVPSGTSLEIEVRAGTDPEALGNYVTVPSNGTDLGTLIDPTARYLQYRVSMETLSNGTSPVLREIAVENNDPASVQGDDEFARKLQASAMAPNPFRRTTSLNYALSEPARVRATVYDPAGRTVLRLEDALRAAGSHRLEWDGGDEEGRPVATGTYFVRLRAGTEELVQRVLVVR